MKAALDIVDITNESSPFRARRWISSSASSTWNDFAPTVSVNDFTENVGWFMYRQRNGDPCDTIYDGAVDSAMALSSLAYGGVLSGPFPSITFGMTYGLGDYVGIVKRGLPGGYLYPSWSEPVASSAACPVTCNGTSYSLGTFAARVLP
jgi:hypothetical protein